jgi:hypothetical protein
LATRGLFVTGVHGLQLLQNDRGTLPALEQWLNIEKTDKMKAGATGLDSDESAAKVNVTLNLVNQRILAMQNATD